MNHLELFSGTHSFGKVAKQHNFNVVSLDRDLDSTCPFSDYNSPHHIKEDIMKWNYKIYKPHHFHIITASPVCLWWSCLRTTWIGRKCKSIHPTDIITQEHIDNNIDKFGKPMIDKLFEIIDYFKPKYYIIENPQTGKLKHYISEKYPQYNNYNDFSYCKFSNWGYEKKTRFWHNLPNIESCLCKKDCENIIEGTKRHKINLASCRKVSDNGKIIRINTKALREKYIDYKIIKDKCSSKFERYRIPEKLIHYLFEKISFSDN